jgi:hypothetical protein
VEVGGELTRVGAERVRLAPLLGPLDLRRELQQATDQRLLSRLQAGLNDQLGPLGGGLRRARALGPTKDLADPGMRVLDVVDRVLVGSRPRQLEVDVDRGLV